jgi:hypothetical protein
LQASLLWAKLNRMYSFYFSSAVPRILAGVFFSSVLLTSYFTHDSKSPGLLMLRGPHES